MDKFEIIKVETEEERAKRLEREKNDNENSITFGANWILSMLEKNQNYSERIPLKNDGTFDIPGNVTELPGDVAQLVRSANRMEYSEKGLYDLAEAISKRHPELHFSFKVDPLGKWIEYFVQKQSLKVGDEVIWESQGMIQWKNPKQISFLT